VNLRTGDLALLGWNEYLVSAESTEYDQEETKRTIYRLLHLICKQYLKTTKFVFGFTGFPFSQNHYIHDDSFSMLIFEIFAFVVLASR